MSTTVLMIFEKGEIIKVKEWFKRICPKDRYPDLPVPSFNCSLYKHDENDRGIYVEFNKNIMELDCAIWDEISYCFAISLAKEIIKQYKVKNAGVDSIGYVGIKEFNTFTGALSKYYKNNKIANEDNWREKLEEQFGKKAKELIEK